MCGILGILNREPKPVEVSTLSRALNTMDHRGPDDEGYLIVNLKAGKKLIAGGRDTPEEVFRSALSYAPKIRIDAKPPIDSLYNIALGHKRLAIIDLSPSGHQPMCNKNGTLWVVYNGEIYNYLELRAELEAVGHSFQSDSDTEVLLTAYEHWDRAALHHFVGMFAFAILDTRKKEIFLARDFFGIKPLYYTLWPQGFAFASEIKALLELPWVHRNVNHQRLYHYLRFGVTDHGGETLFSDIHQLPSAHCLTLPLDLSRNPEIRRYWQMRCEATSPLSFEKASHRARELFLESIRLHLRSDVGVGSALSGGIDSSSIVMAISKLNGTGENFHTFSYIPKDTAISEETWVDIIANASGASVHKVHLNAQDLLQEIDDLIRLQEEPFLSTSILAQCSVFRVARQTGVKVMLDGQGGDEIFGGYQGHLAARLASLFWRGKWIEAECLLKCGVALPGTRGRSIVLTAGRLLLPPAFQGLARALSYRGLDPPWLDSRWFVERGVTLEPLRKAWGKDAFKEHLHQTLVETMLPMLLRYEDRNSMAFSIESRVPFLTPQLVDFAFSLPDSFILSKECVSKAVFRSAMRGIVPDRILDRRDKVAFITPEQDWFLALRPWFEKILQSETSIRMPPLNHAVIERDWRSFLSGKTPFDSRFWRWINLIRWAEQYEVAFD